MSDIQELIHRQGIISFNVGVKTERERIIKLIYKLRKDTNLTRTHYEYSLALSEIEELIKAENA
jgi:hypothetical protein